MERPRGWAFGIGAIREIPSEPVPGIKQRKFEMRVTENPMTRAQLLSLRDLLSLVLAEAPEPVEVTPVPSGAVADATGTA